MGGNDGWKHGFLAKHIFQGVAPVHENPGSPTKTKQAVAGL